MIEENKHRALRKGLDARLIDFRQEAEAPARLLIRELLDFVDDVVDDLGSRAEFDYLRGWVESGQTGADRQLAAFEATHDMRAVVDLLAEETRRGL